MMILDKEIETMKEASTSAINLITPLAINRRDKKTANTSTTSNIFSTLIIID
jgi:hypothetical protein